MMVRHDFPLVGSRRPGDRSNTRQGTWERSAGWCMLLACQNVRSLHALSEAVTWCDSGRT